MKFHRLIGSEDSFSVLLLEDLRRDLPKVHNLSLAALAIDLVIGLIEHITVIFVGKVVVNVVVELCCFSSLFHPEEQVYPVIDGRCTVLTFEDLSHLSNEEVRIVGGPRWKFHVIYDFSALGLA